jgi:hypothetical protein
VGGQTRRFSEQLIQPAGGLLHASLAAIGVIVRSVGLLGVALWRVFPRTTGRAGSTGSSFLLALGDSSRSFERIRRGPGCDLEQQPVGLLFLVFRNDPPTTVVSSHVVAFVPFCPRGISSSRQHRPCTILQTAHVCRFLVSRYRGRLRGFPPTSPPLWLLLSLCVSRPRVIYSVSVVHPREPSVGLPSVGEPPASAAGSSTASSHGCGSRMCRHSRFSVVA